MKKFTFSAFLLALTFAVSAQVTDPNNGLKHIMTAEEAANKDKIALGFVETDPPTGVIRNVEEFGNNEGVLIRYPFGIPMSLIKEMAKDAKVTTIVSSSSQQTTVTNQYQTNGVNLANCSFLIAPTDSYWTRDYGPWYVTFGNKEVGIVDFPYNRPRPNDDELPKKVAASQGIPWFGMNVIHTGGNYMCNGLDQASSTTLVWDENPGQSAEQISQKMLDYLGINNYMVVEDPNNTYIDHIDCWGKFIAPDKVLIRKVPASHPQFDELEATAAFFANQPSSYGSNYKVFRVNTPNNEPYSNSFILKNKVCVPIMGTNNDAAALLAYQVAMPGYQILGFLGNPSTPWESTDALHCRTHEIADQGMLLISHMPLYDSVPAQSCFEITAQIDAFSNSLIYPDSVWTIYKTGSSEWDTLTMINTSNSEWKACIPGQMEGTAISYFIQARDASGRLSNHPYIGAPDPHKFAVKISVPPALVVSPDSLIFLSLPQMIEGKTAVVRNFTNQNIEITEITQPGVNAFAWYIDPWSISLPYTIQSGDTLALTVKLPIPVSDNLELWCDTLHVNTAQAANHVMVCVDPLLLSKIDKTNSTAVNVYPNPVSQSTTFRFSTRSEGKVRLEIYDATGQIVAVPYEGVLPAGEHLQAWQCADERGNRLPTGIYVYRLIDTNSVSGGRITVQ